MPSTSESLTDSPISKVPYDVLVEIFVHCLPDYPLQTRQPNTTTAPMLLCQVCSFWRMAALTSPTLWIHLSYSLTLARADVHTMGVLKSQIAFLRWWKKNQGSLAPFLYLDVWWKDGIKSKGPEDLLETLETNYFLEYLCSAQYLNMDAFFWFLIERWSEEGNQIVCPNLHTAVKFGWVEDDSFHLVRTFIPNYPLPALRHLSIRHDTLPDSNIIPIHCSTLTHLSLHHVYIPLNFWFSFLRAVPCLQWGSIDIDGLTGISQSYAKPTIYTHSQLSTLLISVQLVEGGSVEFPLSLLFTNLYLPTLRILSVSSYEGSWHDERATTELYTVLKSTPAVSTLILGEHFLSLYEPGYNTAPVAARGVAPVWTYAKQLIHLQLELRNTGSRNEAAVAEALNTFVRNAFFSNSKWLDLENPASPLRTITIIDKMPSEPQFDSIRNFTMSSIQKYAKKAPNIVFEITSESAIQIAAEECNQWGSIF